MNEHVWYGRVACANRPNFNCCLCQPRILIACTVCISATGQWTFYRAIIFINQAGPLSVLLDSELFAYVRNVRPIFMAHL